MRVAITALTLSLAACPLSAQEAVADNGGWSIEAKTYLCEAKHPIAGFDGAALYYTRTVRGDRPSTLSLRGDIGWRPTAVEGVRPPPSASAQLFWSGSDAAIGKGTVYNHDAPDTRYPWKDVLRFNDELKPQFAARTAADATLDIRVGAATIVQLPLGNISTGDVDMDGCMARLERELINARPEGENPGSGARGPVPRTSPGRWVTSQDYPSRALREEIEGTTRYEATIDRFGIVTQCRVIVSSGNERLDTATCRNIERRARFYPARDASDEAIASRWQQNVIWRLPE